MQLKLIKCFYCDLFRKEIDNCLPGLNNNASITLIPSADLYKWAGPFLKLFKNNAKYTDILQRICRYIIVSLESDNPKLSYIGIALNKTHSLSWIRHIKRLLHTCCLCMEKLKPGKCFRRRSSLR